MELIVVAIVAVLGFGLFFFVLKRLLRMAIRLALFGAVLLALVAGAAAWWWYAPLGDSSNTSNRNRNGSPARPSRTPR
jgi:multisubunit Na+/H+ antiporter MnhC subunit